MRPCPIGHGLLDLTCFSEVTRQQFRLALGNFGELAFEGFGNTSVKRTSRFAQQRAIGRILHERVLEQIGRLRRRSLPEKQTSGDEAIRSADAKFRSLACALQPPVESCENSRPITAPICATSLAGPSRSSRAISEACKLAGTATAGDGAIEIACAAAASLPVSNTALVISSTNSGMPSVRSMMS